GRRARAGAPHRASLVRPGRGAGGRRQPRRDGRAARAARGRRTARRGGHGVTHPAPPGLRGQPAPRHHPDPPPARPPCRSLHARRWPPDRARVLDGRGGTRRDRPLRRACHRRPPDRRRDHLPRGSVPPGAVLDLRRRGVSRPGRAVGHPAAAHPRRGRLRRRDLAELGPSAGPLRATRTRRILTAVHRPPTDARAMGRMIARLQRAAPSWNTTALAAVAQETARDPFRILISCLLSLRTKDETTGPASARLFALADTPAGILALSPR